MSPQPNSEALPYRHRSILRAVDAGRGEVLCGCAPDLLIDGRFCDHVATHELFAPVSSSPSPDRWGIALLPRSPTQGD